MRDPCHVVLCITADHAQHAGAALHSLALANSDCRFRATVFVDQHDRRVAALQSLAELHRGILEIELREARASAVAGLPLSHHGHWMAYFKLLAIDQMAEITDRVLLLDADVVVVGPCHALLDLELDGAALAATPEFGPAGNARLAIPDVESYFNTGVLLVDTARFSEERLAQRALEFAGANLAAMRWWDQCALNAVAIGRIRPLPARWNVQGGYVIGAPAGYLAEARAASRIVHFSGSSKPWHYRCEHPWRELYWSALAGTPWQDARPTGRSPRSIASKLLVRPLRETAAVWRKSMSSALAH